MRTDQLRINQLSPSAFAWFLDYVAAIDAKDLARYRPMLADNCTFQVNNGPPTVGKSAVLTGLGHYWPKFSTLEHDLLNVYGTDTSFAVEALNHYTRLDGRAVTLRAVAFTDRDATGLVTSIRVYSDPGPLFDPNPAEPGAPADRPRE
jgi:hypothetical protein